MWILHCFNIEMEEHIIIVSIWETADQCNLQPFSFHSNTQTNVTLTHACNLQRFPLTLQQGFFEEHADRHSNLAVTFAHVE